MKNVIKICSIIILTAIIFTSGMSQSGPPWIKTTLPYNYIMRGIDFPANQDQVGFMAGESLTYNGNGIVIKTTDGGNTWTQKWFGANMGVEGSCFVDENNGFIAGWPKLSSGWSGFGRTTDGGDTWVSPAVTPDVYYFNDVIFKDANNGIVIGSTNTNPVVYATSNGGNSWTLATGVSNGVPYHACYVSGSTYFLVDNGGRIKKSVNDGITWTTVFTVPGGLLTGIDFFNDNIGMACGDNGLIVKTADGGANWQVQQIGTDIWHDFGWQNQEHLFVCGTPEIVGESTNAGATWVNGFPASTYQAALYECIFTENGTGFICGSQGTLLKRMPACVAAFTVNDAAICTGESVNFTSQSSGNVSTYEWTFEGGTPQSSNNPDPVVTYNTPGIYDVTLIVSNGYWSDTLVKPDYIKVTDPQIPVVQWMGYELTSSVANGNQWYKDGSLINGATGQVLQLTENGIYWARTFLNGCLSDTSNNVNVVLEGVNSWQLSQCRLFFISSQATLKFKINSGVSEIIDFKLFNTVGQIVANSDKIHLSTSGEGEIYCGDIPDGIYLAGFELNGQRVIQKVIVRK